MSKDIIGLHVLYSDYLGMERYGTIVSIEPYPYNLSVAYVYIEDDDSDYNIHQDIINGEIIQYAEIRLSTEVQVDE